MAHEVAETADDRPALAYFGQAPWHRLGTRLEDPATAAQAMQAAGLDYQVSRTSLQTSEANWCRVTRFSEKTPDKSLAL